MQTWQEMKRQMEDAERIAAKLRQMQAEEAAHQRAKAAFLQMVAEALRPVIREELAAMATKIGKVDQKALAKGKIKPVSKRSVSQKIGAKAKADRIEKGLRKNREAKR